MLIELGDEKLADALIELAYRSEANYDYVMLLCSDQDEIHKQLMKRVNYLKTFTTYVPWNELYGFARMMSCLLDDIKVQTMSPEKGIELMIGIYESDANVMENSDDDGVLGDAFTYEAPKVLEYFLYQVDEKDIMIARFKDLAKNDNYGARERILKVVDIMEAE